MWRMRNTTTASEKQLLWLIGWITADGTNFFEILVPFPFFPRFQIYARSGGLIRISKNNQERKKLSFLRQFDRKIGRIFFLSNWRGKIVCNFESLHKALCSCLSLEASSRFFFVSKILTSFIFVLNQIAQFWLVYGVTFCVSRDKLSH